ncbi:MAG: DUF3784 domain-containing protein [Eubacteriales bacterium]|nr:DUF3784 domain-containing protein [Eubacteriales bacterium]
MIGTILSGIIGVLFLVGAVMQYRCRGPIWSAEYIASSQKERKRLRTKRAYYVSATACLLIGMSLVLLMIYGLTEIIGFIYGVCVLAVLLFVLLILGAVSAVRKSTERGQDSVIRRENLDDVFPDEIEEEFRRRRMAKRRAERQKRAAEENRRPVSASGKQQTSASRRRRK